MCKKNVGLMSRAEILITTLGQCVKTVDGFWFWVIFAISFHLFTFSFDIGPKAALLSVLDGGAILKTFFGVAKRALCMFVINQNKSTYSNIGACRYYR